LDSVHLDNIDLDQHTRLYILLQGSDIAQELEHIVVVLFLVDYHHNILVLVLALGVFVLDLHFDHLQN
jgi:hypothetical protein